MSAVVSSAIVCGGADERGVVGGGLRGRYEEEKVERADSTRSRPHAIALID
jgi:hypothetical protein